MMYTQAPPAPRAVRLPLDRILPRGSLTYSKDPALPLEALAASIQQEGLREPITVRPAGDRFQIVEGNRRFFACRMLGIAALDALILPADLRQANTAEELLRGLREHTTHYLDEADALNRLSREFGLDRAQIAQRLGVSSQEVTARLTLTNLGKETREALRRYRLPERVALALARLPQEAGRVRIAERVAREGLCIRDVELLVTAAQKRLPVPQIPEGRVLGGVKDVRPYLNAMRSLAEQMRAAGIPVEVEENTGGGKQRFSLVMPRRRRAMR